MSYNFKSSTACLTSLFASWLLGAMPTPSALADETYKPIGIVQLPPGSNPLVSTDISWDDPGSHTYALADRSNKSIDVDTRNHKVRLLTANFAGVVASPGQSSGPNGVIIVEHRDVWAGDGPDQSVHPCTGAAPNIKCTTPGSVKVINLETGKLKATIYPPGGNGRVDELCASSDVVLAASNATAATGDAFLTFIDEDSFEPLGQIFLDGSPKAAINPNTSKVITAMGIEQCQFNRRNGKFYQSLVDIGGGSGAVLRISGHAPFKVEKVFQIDKATGCQGPAGLTIGPFHQILVGCNGSSTVSLIIDDDFNPLKTVKVAHATKSGPDEVWYDRGSNHYFLQQATPGVLGVEDAGDGEKTAPSADPPATTPLTAKNPAVDPLKNHVYLPILAGATGSICKDFKGDNSKGCIGIYTAPLDKDDCLAEGEAVIEVDEDGDAKHRKVRCDRD